MGLAPDGTEFNPSFYLRESIPVGSPRFRAMIDRQRRPFDWREDTRRLHERYTQEKRALMPRPEDCRPFDWREDTRRLREQTFRHPRHWARERQGPTLLDLASC